METKTDRNKIFFRKIAIAVTVLCVITLLAAFSDDPLGPFDARTYEPIRDLKVEFPAIGLWTMPLDLAGNIFAGAPTPLRAFLSFAAWTVILAALVSWLKRKRGGYPALRSCLYASGTALCAFMAVATYGIMLMLVNLPGYRLVKNAHTADLITVDLHSHTLFSHDSFVTPEENLLWHRQRGFDVVAITEHNNVDGAIAAMKIADADPTLPAVIPGVEVSIKKGKGFLCAVGVDPARSPGAGKWTSQVESIVALARHAGAAIFSLEFKLDPDAVPRLVKAGVDGFDVVSFGHPDRPEDVHRAVMDALQKNGLVAVGWTDWHGWGGFSRVWTTVRVPSASSLGREGAARAVVDALKERRFKDVVPVVAGRLGHASELRVVTAPVWESIRYARELSAAQAAALWAWTAVFLTLSFFLGKTGLRPLPVLAGTYAVVIALAAIYGGSRLIWLRLSGIAHYPFPMKIGLITMLPAVWTLWLGLRALRREALIRNKKAR
jgi:hypothetical protein